MTTLPRGTAHKPSAQGERLPAKASWCRGDLVLDDYSPDYTLGWPILIVCPTSVIKNWEREFNTWGAFRWVC